MDTLKRLRKYIISSIIGLLLVFVVCYLKDFSFEMEGNKIVRILCDGTFFASVILIGFGLMLSISNLGLFTAVSYSFKRFFAVFSRDYKSHKKDMPDYYQYRTAKLENQVSGAFMYIPGVVYFVISVIFLMLYN